MTKKIVAIVGLGYVGLPLALAFGKLMPTIGFEKSLKKIRAYREGCDPTGEMDKASFEASKNISFTDDFKDLKKADFVIIAVPTPVTKERQPDLSSLKKASEQVGRFIKRLYSYF